jgi:hypothetical protein
VSAAEHEGPGAVAERREGDERVVGADDREEHEQGKER